MFRKIRPIYWFIAVIAPLVCDAFFLSLMGEGLPEQLPVGVVDADGTQTSRSLVRNLNSFQMMDVSASYPNVSAAREAMQRGEIYAFYYIPRGTSRDVVRGEAPVVSFYANYSYLVAGSLSYRDMRMMSELFSGAAARTVLYAHGLTEDQAMAKLQPIVVEMHEDGNPWLNYSQYLSTVLLPGLLMLFTMFTTVYVLGQEVKQRPLALRQQTAYSVPSILRLLWPVTAVFFLHALLQVFLFYGVCGFPCRTSYGAVVALMALSVLAAQGLGVFFFTMQPTPRMSLSLASLWSVLSFSICGMSFPVMAMHPALRALSWLFPLRHYFIVYTHQMLGGLNALHSISQTELLSWLCLAGFALLPLACFWRLKRVLRDMPYVE